MKFLWLLLVSGPALADWTGTWVGQGSATLFGEGPFECSNISYQVTREAQANGFTLTRTGTTQQCGPYQVFQGTLKSEVSENAIWITTRAGEKQKIGRYSETQIDVDFECQDCTQGIGRITETARLTSPNTYDLESTTYSKSGQVLLQYRYSLSRLPL